MAEGQVPDQEAVDEVRREARLDALRAIRDLEQFLRGDDGMGGIDAIRIGVLSQQVTEKVRVYRMAVNIGDEPAQRGLLADAESARRQGIGRRARLLRHTVVPNC
ncbi:MAG TPA: hypothetical protein VHF90_04830 [Thermoleophilaceae bacterium]|nr:hypothetical protein [Thermoleophilaceae bacterium]